MYRVTLSLGGSVIRKYPFDKARITIGRDPDCDISIDNVAVSRSHATISNADGQFLLEDLQSGNGVFVGGQKVISHRLESGETFVIGKYSLLFETVSDAESVVRDAARMAGGEDATFRLDRKELEKLIGKAGKGGEGKATLIPEGGGPPVQLSKPYVFAGSTADASIEAGGAFVAPRIAVFLREETSFRLVRIGGKFGRVEVNGKPADNHALRSGDVINLCGKRFQFTME